MELSPDRAFTILVSGDPNNFTVRIGIGKWLEHRGVAALETLLLSDLVLVVDVAETAWNVEIEDKLAEQIESFRRLVREQIRETPPRHASAMTAPPFPHPKGGRRPSPVEHRGLRDISSQVC